MSLYLVAGNPATTDTDTAIASRQHLPTRRRRAYPSDTTDSEWQILAPLIPVGGPPPGRGGRPVTYPRRDIVDAIRYLDHNGCVWRALPIDFPTPQPRHPLPPPDRDGTSPRSHAAAAPGPHRRRPPPPTDLPAPSTPIHPRRRNRRAAQPRLRRRQNVNGRKRHIVVDTTGCSWRSWSPAPTSKTATAPAPCSKPCDCASPGSP
jgi:putative transposase